MPSDPNHNLEERLFAAIKDGQVKMTPRWHFLLHTIFLSVGGVILILTLLYIASFIIFMLGRTGISSVPGFGLRGWYAFLVSLPWLLIGLSVLFIILLEALVQRTAFAYRRPVLYTTFGLVIIVLVGGFLVAATPLHRGLADFAEKGRFPIGGKLYRSYANPKIRNIHHGKINQMLPDGFLLGGRYAETFTVYMTRSTRLPYGADFEPGDFVVVFGPHENGIIKAYGIQEVKE